LKNKEYDFQPIDTFVWFYGAPAQFRSFGDETGTMILTYLGCYSLKATPGVKTTSPAEA
jgi:hypothetical protein